MSNRPIKLQDTKLYESIVSAAEYPNHPEVGVLTEDDIRTMHKEYERVMSTTNGDSGDCVVNARLLSLLLDNSVTK